MSEKKRFYKFLDDKQEWVIRDRTNRRQEYRVGRNKRYTEKLVDLLNDQQPIINKLKEENEQLQKKNKFLEEDVDDYHNALFDLHEKYDKLEKENEQLHHKLKQTKEYLQIKIDECKNHKKMKEIVFGVEQAVGYEKALLQFQKGLKRRLNDE